MADDDIVLNKVARIERRLLRIGEEYGGDRQNLACTRRVVSTETRCRSGGERVSLH